MEWAGWFALIMMLCYSSYPGKVKKLERKVKKLEQKQKGENAMARLIEELVHKNCKIRFGEAVESFGMTEITCLVVDVDEDWMKIEYDGKKGNKVVKVIRVEDVVSVEMV